MAKRKLLLGDIQSRRKGFRSSRIERPVGERGRGGDRSHGEVHSRGWGYIQESVVSECDGDILITEEGPRKQLSDCYLPCMRAEPVVTEIAAVLKSMIVPASKVAALVLDVMAENIFLGLHTTTTEIA